MAKRFGRAFLHVMLIILVIVLLLIAWNMYQDMAGVLLLLR